MSGYVWVFWCCEKGTLNKKIKSMQRPGTEAIRAKIQPPKQNRKQLKLDQGSPSVMQHVVSVESSSLLPHGVKI